VTPPLRFLLSIDQGTTGTTVLILDRRARVRGRAYAEHPQIYPKPGWVEHDPEAIWRSVSRVVTAALANARVRPAEVAGIGITNQRETTVLWDRRTGRPVHNGIVWQCRRTAPLCDRLKARGLAGLFRRKTGLVIDAYFSGTKIRWLLDHLPGLRRKAAAGRIAFGTIDSWLLWKLTGGRVHATDWTNASRTLLYNIRTHRWDPELMKCLKVPAAILPRVLGPTDRFGETAALGFLPAGIPIAGIAGDQQASMVGHGCLGAGSAKNTYGTGCFLLLNTGRKFVVSRQGLLTTLVYGGSDRPAYALEGAVFIAGAAIQWLRDELKLIGRAADTEPIARRLTGTGGVYMVPAFVGLGAPHWDMHARGAIVGLTRGSNREVIVRATLESLAYQTLDVAEGMEKDGRIRLKNLRVDGGAAENRWLMQFQADLLGVPVLKPPMVANTGKGAALLAGVGIGWWKPSEIPRLADRPGRTFRPRMAAAERRRLVAGWREAVDRVRSPAA